jgi:transposase
VPYQLVGQLLDIRRSGALVECLHRSRRVASHRYSQEIGAATTLAEHRPRAHREYLDWTPQRLVAWAQETGPHVGQAVEQVLSSKSHPHQGFHAALGLRSLAKGYGKDRLEAACHRALRLGAVSYTSLRSMLQRGLESQPIPEVPEPLPSLDHDNVRGAAYYCQAEEGVSPC